MQVRRLGAHGPELTVVGVGTWAIGGPWERGGGPQDDQASIAALHHAFDAGVNWVDTAAAYGHGHAERLVGQVVRETTRPVMVTTTGEGGRRTDRPASVRDELDASLERLGLDQVDLYRVRVPGGAAEGAVAAAWGTLAELADEGRARWVGLDTTDTALLARCERIRHVDAVRVPLSLVDRGARADLLPWCEANGTGVLGARPMAGGLLSGAFDQERRADLDPGDQRRRDPAFTEPRLGANLAVADRLRPVAERHGVPVAAVAVAWVTAQQGVTAAVAGARRPSQVDGWLPAGTLDLTDEDLTELEHAATVADAGQR